MFAAEGMLLMHRRSLEGSEKKLEQLQAGRKMEGDEVRHGMLVMMQQLEEDQSQTD